MKLKTKMRSFFSVIVILILVLSTAQLVWSAPKVKIELSPSKLSVSLEEEFEISIEVNPGEYGVSGGEINLAYDPDLLEVVELKPGDLFGPAPLVGVEKIDKEAGTVKYALARKGATSAPTPPGSFARIRLKALKTGVTFINLTFIGLADQSFNDIPKEEMEIENSMVLICPKATTTMITVISTKTLTETVTLTTTSLKTEKIPTTMKKTVTSLITTTKTITSKTTPQTFSYLGGGLAVGLVIGILIGYVALRRP